MSPTLCTSIELQPCMQQKFGTLTAPTSSLVDIPNPSSLARRSHFKAPNNVFRPFGIRPHFLALATATRQEARLPAACNITCTYPHQSCCSTCQGCFSRQPQPLNRQVQLVAFQYGQYPSLVRACVAPAQWSHGVHQCRLPDTPWLARNHGRSSTHSAHGAYVAVRPACSTCWVNILLSGSNLAPFCPGQGIAGPMQLQLWSLLYHYVSHPIEFILL